MKRFTLTWLTAALLGLMAPKIAASPRDQSELGNPIITNYSRDEYRSATQVWASSSDARGVMYFASSTDILEFDGFNWRTIAIPSIPARSIASHTDGTLYVGLFNEIGYLSSNPRGEMEYVSLLDRVPEKERRFGNVWNTISMGGDLYFVCGKKIFWKHGENFEVINIPVYMAFPLRDSIYVIGDDRGIFILEDGRLTEIPFFKQFDRKKEFGKVRIAPWKDGEVLIVTSSGRQFVHDTNSNSVEEVKTEVDEYIKRHKVQSALTLDDGSIALGTWSGGIAIIDVQGRFIRVINKNRGLVDDMVYSMLQDRFGDLWATTNNGISRISLSLPFSRFDKRNGLESKALSIIRHDETLYVGTYEGVQYLKPYELSLEDDIHDFGQVSGTEEAAWDMLEYQGIFFSSNHPSLFQISDFKVHPLASVEYPLSICQSRKFEDTIFVGSMGKIQAYRITPPGEENHLAEATIIENKTLNSLKGSFYFLVNDSDGNLWASSMSDGIVHIKWPGKNFDDVEIVKYGVEDGLPNMKLNYVLFVDDRFMVGTLSGPFKIEYGSREHGDEKYRFVPATEYGDTFYEEKTNIAGIQLDKSDNIWFQNSDRLGPMKKNTNGSYTWETELFGELSASRPIYIEDDGIIWIGDSSKGLYRYDPKITKNIKEDFATLIRKVTTNETRVLDLHGEKATALDFRENSIAFEYAAVYYEQPEKTEFKYKLAGFDEKWSDWSPKHEKEYTNLPEGEYGFYVKAKNFFEHESPSVVFKFSILPPWYRTRLAYVGYLLIGVLFVIGCVRIYNWRLIASRARLKKIVRLKTSEVVAQRDQIKKANEALWGEMELAKKIQTVLLPEDPKITGYEIAAYMKSADEVGGDYYDIINAADSNWVVIGDVSGHGVPAGLVMMMVQTAIHTALEDHASDPPQTILETVNRVIYDNIKKLGESKYMTITVLSCEEDGTFSFSGLHQDILIYRAIESQVERVETKGIWLGVAEDISNMLEISSLKLGPGDTMLLFTDGITEALLENGEMFSSSRLATILGEKGNKPVTEIQDAILNATDGCTCNDDITFVLIKKMPD